MLEHIEAGKHIAQAVADCARAVGEFVVALLAEPGNARFQHGKRHPTVGNNAVVGRDAWNDPLLRDTVFVTRRGPTSSRR